MDGRVLVVDDDEIVLKSCTSVLNPEGFKVDAVTNAADAMQYIKSDDFDVIITDLFMQETDGFELINWIKEINPAISIVVITGYATEETMLRVLKVGIVDLLQKPFSPHVLIDVTTKAVQLAKKFKPLLKEALVERKEEAEYKLEELNPIIAKYKKQQGSLINALQEAQEIIGYLPPVVQKFIAKGLKIPVSEIHSVVSFYPFFTMKIRGKHNIKVCLGPACYVKKAQEIIKQISGNLGITEGNVTNDRLFSFETVRCVGACGSAPVMEIDHDTYGAVDSSKVLEILKHYS
ncbi:NADH:ubiquinone oxidoreductase, 24 kDa subunit [Candidatus Magnetoovum chiemensis]|nr:NADH:ubiquinone oxidoreductase, 24 kDa subunit [Candidatus Magnetoovum chiemensis]